MISIWRHATAALLPTAVIASALAAMGSSTASHSATFVVTSTADGADLNPGDDICSTSSNQCTLRAAVMEANASADANSISLEAPAPAIYAFTLSGASEDAAAIGDLDIKQNLTIAGRGPSQDTVDAGGLDRAFHVLGSGTSAVLKGMTITGGDAGAPDGGGVLNAGDLRIEDAVIKGNTAGDGGGVSSHGLLTVVNSVIDTNTSPGQGGGISIFHPDPAPLSNTVFSLRDSLLTGNDAESLGGGIFVSLRPPLRYEVVRSSLIANLANTGGGIWNSATEGNISSLIRDSTLAQNKVAENCSTTPPTPGNNKPPGGQTCTNVAEGGGLVNVGILHLMNDTIVYNIAPKGGGGIANGTASIAGQTSLSNSIIAGNTNGSVPDNCSRAALTSLGSNIEDTANDCGMDSDPGNPDADGDLTSTDPQLGVAQTDPFGVTLFYPPVAAGPAVDNGSAPACTPNDQLGQPRPADGNDDSVVACDIGAIELYKRPPQCSKPGNVVCGTGGDDEIQGTEGDDILVGGPGDDHIVCGDGDDTVYAGAGNDDVDCGEGDDILYGSEGADVLVGGPGNDEFFAGGGDDEMFGDFQEPHGATSIAAFAAREGKDRMRGQGGDDFAFGGGAFDRLLGGNGKDRLWGGSGDDTVEGEDGPDKLYGQDGDDELDGGEASDELRAGDGRDICTVGDKDTVTQSCEEERRSHRRSH
jgi:CSLREA domain-containing protein